MKLFLIQIINILIGITLCIIGFAMAKNLKTFSATAKQKLLVHQSSSSSTTYHDKDDERIHQELSILIEKSASTAEAAEALHNHGSINFLSTSLRKHAGLSLDQVLIDLHHKNKQRVYKTKSIGKCEPTSWLHYTSCMGKNGNCRSSKHHPCKGLCRCNTVGMDECECVKSLKEPMVEDDTNAFVQTIHRASKDMIETGKALIEDVNDAVDFTKEAVGALVDKSIKIIKDSVKKKVKLAMNKISTTREDVDKQRAKVKAIRLSYNNTKHHRREQTRLFKELTHEIGVLNGMEQILAMKNILKLVKEFFIGAKNLLLPDLFVLGASYTSSAAHAAGVEQIVDFRTREMKAFTFGGYSVGTNQLRLQLSGSAYIGVGWQHSFWCKHLNEKYSGLFRTLDTSVSIPGITSLPGFASISVGGVLGISAGGLGVLGKCCPLKDYVKTLSFSVSASVGWGLPISGNAGCTDYHTVKDHKGFNSCSPNLHSFLKQLFLKSPALVLSPINALITLGLAFANDHRAVAEDNFCHGPSLHVCPCNGLPEIIDGCGDRPENSRCDTLGNMRLFKQSNYGKHSKKWTKETLDIVKEYGLSSKEFFHKIFGHKEESICEREPELVKGNFNKDVKYMRVMLKMPKGNTKLSYYDEEVEKAVKQYRIEHKLSHFKHLDKTFWDKLCAEY